MTTSRQIVLLGALLIVIIGVGGWRTWSAMKETRGGAGQVRTNEQWLTHLKVVGIDAEAPEGFVPTDNPNKHCAGVPVIPLARLRWRDQARSFAAIDSAEGGLPFPIHNKAIELRSNCVLKGSSDDRGEELEPGEAWLELTVALAHTGKVPFAHLPRRYQPMCVITDVNPGEAGDRAGMKKGDVLVSAGDFDLSKQLVAPPVCNALVAAIMKFKSDETYSMGVIRDGALIQVPRKGGELFGIRFYDVPVLDTDLSP